MKPSEGGAMASLIDDKATCAFRQYGVTMVMQNQPMFWPPHKLPSFPANIVMKLTRNRGVRLFESMRSELLIVVLGHAPSANMLDVLPGPRSG
jgi:hypothetical protein